MSAPSVEIYDTTLRDGAQAEGLSFALEDMLRVTQRLDRLGVAFIEGGWPGSNPRDREYFQKARQLKLGTSRLVAFGSTHHPRRRPDNDNNLAEVAGAGVKYAALVGKSWPRHLRSQLGISPKRNLELVRGSVAFLAAQGIEVFFDAEHFFDGFVEDPEYALAVLGAAQEAGALSLVLCDTNGGSLPGQVAQVVARVRKELPQAVLGIHAHNDADLAVAVSLAAVEAGVTQVQGTLAGFGERCGNANLASIIGNLEVKMGRRCLPKNKLGLLTETCSYIYEVVNKPPRPYAPYVGPSAFTHKGGLHISAVEKEPGLYEHVDPSLVGNARRFVLSDLAGKAAIINKSRQWGIDLSQAPEATAEILGTLKTRERQGYLYEGAEASFELLVNRALGKRPHYFDLVGFRVMDFKAAEEDPPQAEATVRLKVGDQEEHTAAMGRGPVNALDQAMRKALIRFFPQLEKMRLVDYKVRVLTPDEGTEAVVRVLIESSDGASSWGTVGVGFDVLEASWQALGDSVRYMIFKSTPA